jgi:hypothetical protein
MQAEPETKNPNLSDDIRLGLPSASSLEITVECPGMPNLRNTIPREQIDKNRSEEDDEWARRGQRIHYAFQTGNTLELNAEETETYNQGVKNLEMIKARWIERHGLDPSKVKEGERELRVWVSKPWAFPEPMYSAQLDRHFLYQSDTLSLALVVDLKSGWNPNLPPSTSSWQLKSQLIALSQEYELDGGTVAYAKAKDKVEKFDLCDYSETDLKYNSDLIAFHCWQSSQPDAPRRAGTWCRWCPCKGSHCPESLAYALLPSVMASVSKEGRKRVIKLDKVSPDDLYKLFKMRGTITAILDSVKDTLHTWTPEQLAEINLMFGKPREYQTIGNLREVCRMLTDEKQIFTGDQVWAAMNLVVGRLVKTLQETKSMSEKDAKEFMEKILEPYTMNGVGEKTLVNLR